LRPIRKKDRKEIHHWRKVSCSQRNDLERRNLAHVLVKIGGKYYIPLVPSIDEVKHIRKPLVFKSSSWDSDGCWRVENSSKINVVRKWNITFWYLNCVRRKEEVEIKCLKIITDRSRHKGLNQCSSAVMLYEHNTVFNVCHLYIMHSVETLSWLFCGKNCYDKNLEKWRMCKVQRTGD
jgi:hypothetical protein